MPVMTGMLRPFFQNTARARPPTSAPPVSPRKAKAAFKTKSTFRLRYAPKLTPGPGQSRPLAEPQEEGSLFRGTWFTKSIVDTEARAVSAELTEDMAADSIATIKNPRNM